MLQMGLTDNRIQENASQCKMEFIELVGLSGESVRRRLAPASSGHLRGAYSKSVSDENERGVVPLKQKFTDFLEHKRYPGIRAD